MLSREIEANYVVECEGIAKDKVAPLHDRPAHPDITIYKDGSREVGCPYLDPDSGNCQAALLSSGLDDELKCIRLFPLSRSQDIILQAGLEQRVLHEVPQDTEWETYGEAIRYFLYRSGMNQREFAKSAGISYANSNKLLNDRNTSVPRIDTVMKQARALNLDKKETQYLLSLAMSSPQLIQDHTKSDIFQKESLPLPIQHVQNEFLTREQGFRLLQEFVHEAVKQKVHLSVPGHKFRSTQQWANHWNFLGMYLFSPDVILEDIAGKYGLTKQRIDQIVKRAAELLYEYSPYELKLAYHPSDFNFNKPATVERRRCHSDALRGHLREAEILAREGYTLKQIREQLGLSAIQAYNLTKSLVKIGIDLRNTNPLRSEEFNAALGDNKLSMEEKQKLLNQLVALGDPLRKNQNIIYISTLREEAGLSSRKGSVVQIEEAIRRNGIAVRLFERVYHGQHRRYLVGIANDRDAILWVLQNDQALDYLRR